MVIDKAETIYGVEEKEALPIITFMISKVYDMIKYYLYSPTGYHGTFCFTIFSEKCS